VSAQAALGVQAEAAGLAAEVKLRDGLNLALRVGLNSGRVIGVGSVLALSVTQLLANRSALHREWNRSLRRVG
jgi:hypothetical protein